jgi:hypothetical protein
MKVVIEFYRIREADHAHAIVGREIADATDLDDAVEIARRLWQTLDMPHTIRSVDELHRLSRSTSPSCIRRWLEL